MSDFLSDFILACIFSTINPAQPYGLLFQVSTRNNSSHEKAQRALLPFSIGFVSASEPSCFRPKASHGHNTPTQPERVSDTVRLEFSNGKVLIFVFIKNKQRLDETCEVPTQSATSVFLRFKFSS